MGVQSFVDRRSSTDTRRAAPLESRRLSRADRPIVIAHRGASGSRPEHTLEAYRLAAEQGADFLEPDLVITRDGVLVARHENEIGATTDVADHPEFAGRRTVKEIDGRTVEGWFVEDFTLDELRELRARERIPRLRPQNVTFDDRFGIPTFDEILDLREDLEERLGRPLGVYPETKHPTFMRSVGLPLEPPLLEALARRGLDDPSSPVFIQSFETGNLEELAAGGCRLPLVQLIGAAGRRLVGDPRTFGDLTAPEALRGIAGYAAAVGPAKEHVTPDFVTAAHDAGLLVHPYAFRRENEYLPPALRSSDDPAAPGDLEGELRHFLALGVDGVFTDNPDVAAAVVAAGPA